MKNNSNSKLLKGLKFWFIIHFLADVFIALPLFFFPVRLLQIFGWTIIDPIMARLVAAALFGIGIESYLGRNADRNGFVPMLNLKIIWSFFASLGLLLSIWAGLFENLTIGWGIFVIFGLFHLLWVYYRIKLQKIK